VGSKSRGGAEDKLKWFCPWSKLSSGGTTAGGETVLWVMTARGEETGL
jgi:hypothetical protein